MSEKFLHPYHAADYYGSLEGATLHASSIGQCILRNPEEERRKKQERIDKVRLRQAHEEASMSTCVKHSVGAIITDVHGRIVATGYNGTPSGMQNCCDEFMGFDHMLETLEARKKEHEDKFTREDDAIAKKYAEEIEELFSRHHEWSKKHELHAEINAILHSDRDQRLGGTLYVNLQPCMECAKTIAGSGIRRVVFGIPYHRSDNDQVIELFKKRGIEYILIPNLLY